MLICKRNNVTISKLVDGIKSAKLKIQAKKEQEGNMKAEQQMKNKTSKMVAEAKRQVALLNSTKCAEVEISCSKHGNY